MQKLLSFLGQPNCFKVLYTKDTILKITSVFEHAHTDLYLANKGVLLANVLVHNHVSLNQNFTNISLNSESVTMSLKN